MNIPVTRNPNPQSPPDGDYGFGRIFTPHMFILDYTDGQWRDPRIVPYQNFSLDPAAKVLHYGQEIFEGMKAYRNGEDGSVHMFRPDRNVVRFNISCERMCMPQVDPDLFMKALEQLIDIDRDWVRSLEVFYVGGLFLMPAFRLEALIDLLAFCREGGVVTVVDVVIPQDAPLPRDLSPLLSNVDYFLPNDDEARAMTGLSDPAAQLRALLRAAPSYTRARSQRIDPDRNRARPGFR